MTEKTETKTNENSTTQASPVGRLVIREKIWDWLISGYPVGTRLSKPLLFARAILFPLDYFYWVMSESIGYQPQYDIWVINGVKYSGEAMRMLAASSGETYRIKRSRDVLIVEKVIV